MVQTKTTEFTADSFVAAMPLRSGLTPAILIAPWLERGLAVIGLLACLLAVQLGVVAAVRARRSPDPGQETAEESAEETAEETAAAEPQEAAAAAGRSESDRERT